MSGSAPFLGPGIFEDVRKLGHTKDRNDHTSQLVARCALVAAAFIISGTAVAQTVTDDDAVVRPLEPDFALSISRPRCRFRCTAVSP